MPIIQKKKLNNFSSHIIILVRNKRLTRAVVPCRTAGCHVGCFIKTSDIIQGGLFYMAILIFPNCMNRAIVGRKGVPDPYSATDVKVGKRIHRFSTASGTLTKGSSTKNDCFTLFICIYSPPPLPPFPPLGS